VTGFNREAFLRSEIARRTKERIDLYHKTGSATPGLLDNMRIAKDFRDAGLDITSVSELKHIAFDRRAILPMLLDHTIKARDPEVKLELISNLAIKNAPPEVGNVLIDEFRHASGEREQEMKWFIACAIEAIAPQHVVEDVLELAADPRNGSSRLMLVATLAKLRHPRIVPLLMELLQDPDLTLEVAPALARHQVVEAIPHLEALQDDERPGVRKRVQQALTRLRRVRDRSRTLPLPLDDSTANFI